MDQMQESATFSKIVEGLIKLNADLTKFPVRQITDTSRQSLPSAIWTSLYAGAFVAGKSSCSWVFLFFSFFFHRGGVRDCQRKIQETNDGEDVDAVKQTFRMATAPKRKRRLSTKSSELLSNFGNKVGAVMGRIGRRKSINITDPALRPAGMANAPKPTQSDGQPARMSSAERQR